ncbi:MAG: helix-turn-helix domain-containing protein [Ktedonobacteraceae bacterium]
MLESYEINTLEQLRAVADTLRIRIIDLLIDHPMTVTQLGNALGLAPAKIHYHVRELEKVGLLELVEKREKGGVLEKYYQPIARDFSVSKDLFMTAPPDDSLAAMGAYIDQIKDGFQSALRAALERKDEHTPLTLGGWRLYVTSEEHKQIFDKILALAKQYESPRGIEGEQEMNITVIAYAQADAQQRSAPAGTITTKNSWTVGALNYSRQELEQVVAEGQRLNVNVTGICIFANDVSADLADRAIEKFTLIGQLQAPPDVRDVLMKKR